MGEEFFVWESVSNSGSVLLIDAPSALIEFGVDRFTSGTKIEESVPQFEFVLDSRNQELHLLDDVPLVGERMLIVSQRCVDVLRGAGVDNVDCYPCLIVNSLTSAVREDYVLTNVRDRIFCLDWERSRLTVAEADSGEIKSEMNPADIESIDDLKLIESRIEGELLFRLGEEPSLIIVHRSVVDTVEVAGIAGVRFVQADGYVETGLNWETNLMGAHVSAMEPVNEE